MKIDSNVSPLNRPSGGPKSARTGQPPQTQGAESKPQVQISPLSAQLAGAEATTAAASLIDSQKIAEIKQAIAEGRFKIDPEKIAEGLLDSVRQMLYKQPTA